jgi:hypothetical protein
MPGIIEELGPTTLILGAGASAPFDFPLGVDLRNQLLASDNSRDALLHELGFPNLKPFRTSLRHYQAQSIDDYLKRYPEHAQAAKLQIAYHLMRHEDHDGHVDHTRKDNWYRHLYFEVLGDDEWLGRGRLSIVTFNYDLSLEAYLFTTLCARHRIDGNQARERLAALPIVHVHGHLGAVEFIHGKGRPYGRTKGAIELNDAAKRIATVHDEPAIKLWERAHEMLGKANHLLFLGFGFGEENLARLALNSNCRNVKRALLGTMNCDYAKARFEKYAPGVPSLSYKDESSGRPTLDRVKWLFDKAKV